MARPMILDEPGAKLLARECPDKLVEIVQECKGRTGFATAKRVAKVPQFIIASEGGAQWLVAELVARP